jgi:tetratricopeptide (TPR) repeat protein
MLSRVWSVIFTILVALPTTAAAITPEAKALNAEGLRLYKAKKLEAAAEKFARAIEADETYALAHYNYACVLALFRARGEVCDHDAYPSTILEHLQRAVELDPKRRARLREDSDLESIHDTFGYQILSGRKVTDPRDLRAILVAVSWYAPAPGAYGPLGGLHFAANGKLSYWALMFSDDGDARREHVEGTWTLEGTHIELKLKPPGRKASQIFKGTLSAEGVLSIGDFGRYTDNADECSA